MIKNRYFWSLFCVVCLLATFVSPLRTASAASPPLAAGAAAFPGLGELWGAIFPRLVVLLVLTIFDFLFGVILAILGKTFKWDYLLHYLNTDILPILAWMACVVISQIPLEFIPAAAQKFFSGAMPIFEYGVYTTVFLSIVASLFESFGKIGVLSNGNARPDSPK